MTDKPAMTKAERSDLAALIRKREKVMKAEATKRSAQMLADFEKQSAAIYDFNDDETWAKAKEQAEDAIEKASEIIAERCKELGIPKEFAPGVSMYWHGRGENAVKSRQDELRRVARRRIEAIEAEAIALIERESLDAQTQVLAMGLESEAAKKFLESMPPIEKLMPAINAVEIKAIVDKDHKKKASVH